LLRASDLLKVLNRAAGRVSGRDFVRRKCNWARWAYYIRVKGGILVSASKAVFPLLVSGRGAGLGSRPKKMYGERLGDGVEYHLMKPTPRR